jgi:osmotically-inducible protein OsmY
MDDTHPRESAHRVYPFGQEVPASEDDEILAAVLNALHHNCGIPSDHIRAQVKDGRVTLSGIVSQDYESSLAEQAAAGASGVKQVENNLTREN